jgi:hypothetical protein
MAVQKNTHQSTNDFGSLGELIKTHQAGATTHQHQKEGTMPNSKKTTSTSEETLLTPEAILEKAKADGFDITQPHPSVNEFVSALNPYGPDLAEEGSRWVLTLASNDRENPMPIHDFIVESYRDPSKFNLRIANNQGSRNASVIKKIHELVEQANVVATENRNLKEEVKRLNAVLQHRPAPATASEDFSNVFEEAMEHLKAGVASDINEAKATNVAPIDVISRRPTKPVTTVPEKVKLMTVRVEEPTFWETATKAVVTGVVVGAAAYGTIKALEYFFGDDE